MSTTATEIGNVALKAMGHKRIDSIEQETKAARTLKVNYDMARRATLREHPWNFAEQDKALTKSATTVGWKWLYEHPLPVDCLRVTNVEGLDGRFKIMRVPGVGRVIACDETPINITYIADVTVEAEFDPSFAYAFALKLASMSAVDIAGSSTLAADLQVEYVKQLRIARGVDAQENGQDEVEDGGSWNAARNA